MSRLGFSKVTVFHGEACLGELDTVPVQGENFQFPSNAIRIHHISAKSERVHPLSVLRTISTGVRCKLEPSSSLTMDQSLLINLHASCFYELKTAVVIVGNEEVHLVAMPSKLKKFPCFWCYSVPIGLYHSCLVMLNLRCLSIVFDLDETLIVANTMKSFEDRIEALRSWITRESDPIRLSGMTAEMNRYIEDRSLLKQYAESDSVVDGGKAYYANLEEVRQLSDTQERGFRPVIRLVEKNVVLTRINPEIRDTSVLVRLRPAWEDLKSYLTAKGRKRFEVYVCTMAERDYALEMWRLLDPEARLISLKQLMDRIVCVKAGAKKSLLTVFQQGTCHPKMAMVIDDRIKVWEDKDQPRVHAVPAFTPYYAPQAEMANAVPVLCVARNVACNVRGGFFKEFDESLLHKISEIHYEDDVGSLPAAPDVSNYLMSEDANLVPNGNPTVPFSEGINGSEAAQRLYHLDEKSYMNSSSHAINNPAQPKPELSIEAAAKVQGPTPTQTVPFEKPSLASAPFRLDNSLYEFDRNVKRKLPVRGFAEPFMSKLPGTHLAPPSQGGWLAEDAPDRGQLNGRLSGFVQEPNPFKLDQQVHMRQEGMRQNSLTPNNYTGFSGYQNQSVKEHQPEGASTSVPSVALKAIHDIGRKCHSKVELRPVVRTINDLEYSFEVLFAGEKIGLGTGKTRKEAQHQAADQALQSLADMYLSYEKRTKSVGKESDKLSGAENGFIWDMAPESNGQKAVENGVLKENTSKVA